LKKKHIRIVITIISIILVVFVALFLYALKNELIINKIGADSPYRNQVLEMEDLLGVPLKSHSEKKGLKNIDVMIDPFRDDCSSTGQTLHNIYATELTDKEVFDYFEGKIKELNNEGDFKFKKISNDGSISYVQTNIKTTLLIYISFDFSDDNSNLMATKEVIRYYNKFDRKALDLIDKGHNVFQLEIEAFACQNWR